MRLTLLGTGSADGWPNPFCRCDSCGAERAAGRSRRPSSLLIDETILIDCGPTTPHLLPPLDLSRVEHVLITHGHPDHLHPAFLLTRDWTQPATSLHVWAPPSALDLCRDWCGPSSPVRFHALRPGDGAPLESASGTYHARALAARHSHGNGDVVAQEALLYHLTGPDGATVLYATDTGPFDPVAIDVPASRVDVVLLDETFGDTDDHGTGHLDLTTVGDQVSRLRDHGVVDELTRVVATHLSHHNPPTDELRRRLSPWRIEVADDNAVIDTDSAMRESDSALRDEGSRSLTLVLGGARSGKSTYAEQLLRHKSQVTYVATGGTRADDAEWRSRVAAHQARRPASWTTMETTDLIPAVTTATSPVLIDCLTLWLTAQLDDLDAWLRIEAGEWDVILDEAGRRITALTTALTSSPVDVVLVSNEVGMGGVPMTPAGRMFADLLGVLNADVARVSTAAVLMVAGRPLPLAPAHEPDHEGRT